VRSWSGTVTIDFTLSGLFLHFLFVDTATEMEHPTMLKVGVIECTVGGSVEFRLENTKY